MTKAQILKEQLDLQGKIYALFCEEFGENSLAQNLFLETLINFRENIPKVKSFSSLEWITACFYFSLFQYYKYRTSVFGQEIVDGLTIEQCSVRFEEFKELWESWNLEFSKEQVIEIDLLFKESEKEIKIPKFVSEIQKLLKGDHDKV